jgi:hypothetical protein
MESIFEKVMNPLARRQRCIGSSVLCICCTRSLSSQQCTYVFEVWIIWLQASSITPRVERELTGKPNKTLVVSSPQAIAKNIHKIVIGLKMKIIRGVCKGFLKSVERTECSDEKRRVWVVNTRRRQQDFEVAAPCHI